VTVSTTPCAFCGRPTKGEVCGYCSDVAVAERALEADLHAMIADHYNPAATSPILQETTRDEGAL
jgi:hypothetical protein